MVRETVNKDHDVMALLDDQAELPFAYAFQYFCRWKHS